MIKHIKCDIFESGADVILHQVNCQGVMGSGIAKQVREKYPWVYGEYKEACLSSDSHNLLGFAQHVYIDETHIIVNVFGQDMYGYDGKCYTNYYALRLALENVRDFNVGKTIAIPYFMGCARGGGDWNVVYQMIEEIFTDNDVLICKYDGG